jgi:hypothetical protein
VVTLYNISTASLTPLLRLEWLSPALAALHPLPAPPPSEIRSHFLGDQNGIVITTNKCFILAVHKAEGACRVRLQRITSCDASIVTAGSTMSCSQLSSQASEDGDGSAVVVPQQSHESDAAAAVTDASVIADPLPALSGRLFKRSSMLGRVSWTLQLINLNGSTLSYTNKDGKDKAYDLAGCTVAAPQVHMVLEIKQ